MLISRFFFFFNLFSLSNNLSSLRFKNLYSMGILNQIRIGFFIPFFHSFSDLRLIWSFFILFKLIGKLPKIYRFQKIQSYVFGKKQIEFRFISFVDINNINKFFFFDFILDSILTFITVETLPLLSFTKSNKNNLVCIMKHPIFLPLIPDFISFFFSYYFFNISFTNKVVKKYNYSIDAINQIFSILNLKNINAE